MNDNKIDNYIRIGLLNSAFLNNKSYNNSCISTLMYDDSRPLVFGIPFDIEAYSNRIEVKTDPVGYRLLKAYVGNDEAYNRELLDIITESYDHGNFPKNNEFVVDSRLLENQLVIDFLNKNCQKGYINSLRITGDNFILTDQIYNNLKNFKTIRVYKSDVKSANVTEITKDNNFADGLNSNNQNERDFFIKENLTDEDIKKLIDKVTSIKDRDKKVCIRFYNPALTVELINRLDKAGLPNDIGIDILGYPLTENSDIYNSLDNTKRKIDVTYTCCHDLLSDYCHEPFTVDNFYYSELEPGARSDLSLYKKVLDFSKEFEEDVKGVSSNAEKVMLAYQKINKNYRYHPDVENAPDYGAITELHQIMTNHDIICVGYANLLTLMCRRVNIPMFVYSAPSHAMNIARIIEKDENGNVTFDKICTFDPTNDGNYYDKKTKEKRDQKNSYTFFGLDPAMWLHYHNPSFLTLANSLALPQDKLNEFMFKSRSKYDSCFYNTYNSRSFCSSMLHLMGYNFDFNKDYLPDVISTLQSENKIGEIPENMIYSIAENIERRKYPDMNENDFQIHMDEIKGDINYSIKCRLQYYFNYPATRITQNCENGVWLGQKNQKEFNIPKYISDHKHIDLDAIDIGPVKFQNLYDIPNGEIKSEVKSGDQKSPNNSNSEETKIFEPYDIPSETKDEDFIDIAIEPQSEVNSDVATTETSMFTEKDFSDEFIAGTTIRKPRYKNINETDEEYIEFLKKYYDYYFPKAAEKSNNVYHLTKDQIIQDIPIYDMYEQTFKTQCMTFAQIEAAKRNISEYSFNTYNLIKNQIIQDIPLYDMREQIFETPGMSDEEIESSRRR